MSLSTSPTDWHGSPQEAIEAWEKEVAAQAFPAIDDLVISKVEHGEKVYTVVARVLSRKGHLDEYEILGTVEEVRLAAGPRADSPERE